MEYFELFGLPVSFHIDTADLRKRYLKLSRETHPDFHSLSSDLEQAAALDRSTRITNAYNVLRDEEKRMKYILLQKGLLEEEARVQLRPEFLMEMMDLNEAMAMADGEDEKIHCGSRSKASGRNCWRSYHLPWTPLIRTAMNRNSARLSTSTTSNGI